MTSDQREELRKTELAGFLQSRRARLRPADLGLVTAGRRRVSGLRREEAAQLAGVSVDYYIRLEQGRVGRPSEEVLTAVARALRLQPDEERHLFRLARPSAVAPASAAAEPIRPEVRLLLESLAGTPAFVINGRLDLLATNALAKRLVVDVATTPATRANVARMIFMDPVARDYFIDWETVAREACGHLRVTAGERLQDKEFRVLVDDLSAVSQRFRELWGEHEVHQKAHGLKRLRHPDVGELTVWYETLALPADTDQTLVTYAAEPASPSEAAVRRLAETAGART
jgi:transcriptional regulator with XRE-family HTH domain